MLLRGPRAGDVSRAAPIDKLSTVLAILLALILLSEPVTAWSVVGIVVITAGTLLMVDPDDLSGLPLALRRGGSWLTYALASALFAALTSILGKVGISGSIRRWELRCARSSCWPWHG